MGSQDIRWRQRLQNYSRALSLLRGALANGPGALNDLEKEGTVQRFEYTVELAWKTLKDYLEFSGVQLVSVTPKSSEGSVRGSASLGWPAVDRHVGSQKPAVSQIRSSAAGQGIGRNSISVPSRLDRPSPVSRGAGCMTGELVSGLGLDARAQSMLRAVIARHPQVSEAWLFGSRAMGTHRPESDIDIALYGEVDELLA